MVSLPAASLPVALRRAMPQASTQGASPLVGWLLVVSPPGEQRQGAWPLAA